MNKSCFFQDFKTHYGHTLNSCLTDIQASKTQLSEILCFYVNKFIIKKNFTLKISYFSIESLLSRLKIWFLRFTGATRFQSWKTSHRIGQKKLQWHCVSRNYLSEHPEKNTDRSKALTVAEHVPIAVDPYTKAYEEVMTTTDLLELESRPAMMITHVKGRGRTVLPAKMVDPSLHPKGCPLVAAITGTRSIPLELDILDLD